MGPLFAETSGRFAWLFAMLCAGAVALVAVRPCPTTTRVRPASMERFDHYRPVKRCVDGRWVIANDHRHVRIVPKN